MEPTCVHLCPTSAPDDVQRGLDVIVRSGAKSLLILACDADRWAPDTIDTCLTALPLPVFGGVFPQLIHGDRRLDHGALLIGLASPVEVIVLDRLSTRGETLHDEIRTRCAAVARSAGLIVLVDGLATHIEPFVESLYSLVGAGPNVVGGGAGSLDFVQKPCLFTNAGLLQDAAIVVGLPFTVGRGVQHGWEILDGPYLVTGSHGHVLETLNYRPAFDVYRECVEAASALRFADRDFFSIAKTYPFGIERLDGDLLVRDPIRVDHGALICVGDVPEHAMVYVLQGRTARLIESAGEAASEARGGSTPPRTTDPPSALIFDCISRVLFLDAEFDRELNAIRRELGVHRHAFGALTLGEITNTRNGPISLLNKSTVIGVF